MGFYRVVNNAWRPARKLWKKTSSGWVECTESEAKDAMRYKIIKNGSHYNKFSITYNINGGTGNISNEEVYSSANVHSFITSTGSGISRANYDLTGWKDQDGNSYSTGAQVISTLNKKNYSMTAQWQIQHKITYVANTPGDLTGLNLPKTEEYVSRYNGATTNMPTASSTNYKFRGWYTDPNNENSRVGNNFIPTGDTTLYARWGVRVYIYKSIEDNTEAGRDLAAYKWLINKGKCGKAGATNHIYVQCGSQVIDFTSQLFPLTSVGETLFVQDLYLPYNTDISIAAAIWKRGYDVDDRFAEINLPGPIFIRTPQHSEDDYDDHCSGTHKISGDNDLVLNCQWDCYANPYNDAVIQTQIFSTWWDVYLNYA